jgi:hypothetical protein
MNFSIYNNLGKYVIIVSIVTVRSCLSYGSRFYVVKGENGSMINSVIGEIEGNNLGVTLVHEHITKV